MSIQQLPNEIHLQIFKKLAERDLREGVSLVCKQWCLLAQNYGLFKFTVNLDSPFNNSIKQALIDFEKYPTFRHKVKYIELGDYRNYEDSDDIAGCYDVEKKSLDTDDIVAFYDLSKLNSVIESCPNFKGISIWTRCSESLFYIFEELVLKETPFGSQLETFNLYFIMEDVFCRAQEYQNAFVEEVDLVNLINHSMPNLQELSIYSIDDKCEEDRLIFIDDGFYSESKNCFLKKLYIVCISCSMTTSCLEYIISGCLVNLEELDLLVTLLHDPIDVNDNDVVDIEKTDLILEETKIFCQSKLKKYYINIFNGRDGDPVLEIKNY